MMFSPTSILRRASLPMMFALLLAGCATGGTAPDAAPRALAGPRESAPVLADLGQLHERAVQGEARAQYELALHYLQGRGGTTRRPEIAARWLRRAAAQRHDDAQLLLAVLHQRGEGVPVDLPKAFQLAREVAGRGHPYGMGMVAESYEHGRGVKADPAQAVHWYRRAAEAGEPLAQTRLGFLYFAGRGVKQDRRQAVYWLERAATQYHPPAFYMLGFVHLGQEGGPSDPVAAYQWLLMGETIAPRPDLAARNAKTTIESQLGAADLARARRQAGEWLKQHPRPARAAPGL